MQSNYTVMILLLSSRVSSIFPESWRLRLSSASRSIRLRLSCFESRKISLHQAKLPKLFLQNLQNIGGYQLHLWSSWSLRDSAEGALHEFCCCKPFLCSALSSFQALTAPFLASSSASRLTCHLKKAATSELTSAYSTNFIHDATAEFFDSPQTFLSKWELEMDMTNIWSWQIQAIKKNEEKLRDTSCNLRHYPVQDLQRIMLSPSERADWNIGLPTC